MDVLPLTPNGSGFADFLSDLTGGDEKSWNLFIDEFHGLISSTASRCSRQHGENIVPEVYLEILKDRFKLLRQFTGDSRLALLVFVRRVTENVARNFLRKHARQEIQLAQVISDMAEEQQNPEAAFLAETDQERLTQAVSALRQDYREVLALLLKGFQHREVAQILDIPLETSLTRANRAGMILKKVLDFEMSPGRENVVS
jgi:RNA polymerase sigma factor (sigma-70 family)